MKEQRKTEMRRIPVKHDETKKKKRNANKKQKYYVREFDPNPNGCQIRRQMDRMGTDGQGKGWTVFATMAAEPKEKGTLIKEALNSGFRARTTVE